MADNNVVTVSVPESAVDEALKNPPSSDAAAADAAASAPSVPATVTVVEGAAAPTAAGATTAAASTTAPTKSVTAPAKLSTTPAADSITVAAKLPGSAAGSPTIAAKMSVGSSNPATASAKAPAASTGSPAIAASLSVGSTDSITVTSKSPAGTGPATSTTAPAKVSAGSNDTLTVTAKMPAAATDPISATTKSSMNTSTGTGSISANANVKAEVKLLPHQPHPLGVNSAFVKSHAVHLVIKERSLHSEDAFTIHNAAGHPVIHCDGKKLSLSSRKEFFNADGEYLFALRKHTLSMPRGWFLEGPGGERFLEISGKWSLGRMRMEVLFRNSLGDGSEVLLEMKGDFFKRSADLVWDGVPVARVYRRSHLDELSGMEVDTQNYGVEVAPHVDAALISAVVVALEETHAEP